MPTKAKYKRAIWAVDDFVAIVLCQQEGCAQQCITTMILLNLLQQSQRNRIGPVTSPSLSQSLSVEDAFESQRRYNSLISRKINLVLFFISFFFCFLKNHHGIIIFDMPSCRCESVTLRFY